MKKLYSNSEYEEIVKTYTMDSRFQSQISNASNLILASNFLNFNNDKELISCVK